MKKKFLALVLTLAMVLSLVPVTALAAGGNSPVTEVSTDANSPVQIKKSVNEEGNMLTLEAYLTNEVTQTVSAKPLDIVLVLDQSGSMADNFNGKTAKKYSDTRQYAMKSAVDNFVDKVNEQYSEKGNHRMAIVTFGSNATTLHEWTAVDITGVASLKDKVDKLPQNPQGATNVGAGMEMAETLMNSASAGSNTARQKVVIVFTDGVPTTLSDFNTDVANAAITASKGMKNAGAVVYTVGIFNGADPDEMYGASGFDVNSNGMIDSTWKQEEWGLFPNTDFPTVDRPAGNRFLNLLSSNYPAADSIGLQRETIGHGVFHSGVSYTITQNFDRTASNYYLTAGNASGLNNIFQQIIEEISTLEIVADKNAVLSDTLSDYFTLNIPESSNAENAITAKQWDCTGKDENGCYTWKEASTQPEMQINVTDKTVKVTGFDYTKNAVTKTTSGSGAVYSGSKLVVTIPIKPDAAYTKWEKGRNLYPTNNVGDNKAGLSNYKDKNGEALLPTLLTESPEAEVTAYTVTYNWGENAPSGQTLPPDSRNYIPGQSYTVDNTFNKDTKIENASGSYQFSGWTDPNNGVMGTKDVTIIGSWTYTAPEPTTADITVNFYKDSVSEKNKVNQTLFVMKNQTIGDKITLGAPVIDMFKPKGYNSGVQQGTVPYVVVAGTNVINVLYTKKEVNPPVTLDVSRSKIASGLTKNSNGEWTTDVTLTLPTVNKPEATGTAVQPSQTIAISKGSYVIDQIGKDFTFVPELTLKVGDKTYTGQKDGDTNTYKFSTKDGKTYPDTVTYTAKDGDTPAQFTWNINEDVYAGTEVTLSYKLKLTAPKTAAGAYGVTDLDGNGFVDGAETTKVVAADALYTNEKAALYIKENDQGKEIAVFPKPSVSYTVNGGGSGGSGGSHKPTVTIPDDVPTGLNGKDHYAYVVGYPDGMVYPQKNITRAEVATIFFRLLTDETREANMTKSNSYNDMKDGAWYTCAVSTLSKMGIIKGYEDGSFKPDASISRAEFAAIAARFDPDGDKTPATFSDVSSHWAKDEISIAANHGWIKGYEDGSFKPDQKITRAETMTLVNRVLKRLPETKDDLHKDMKTWPDNQKESAWFYLAVQEATNSHYQKLKKDGTHEMWESMRETRDWAALEK